MYRRLLQNEKSLRPLFLRLAKDTLNFQLDERMLRRHATRVMEALGAAVESLDDSAALVPVLHSLGQTHSGYMVKPSMLPVSGLFIYLFVCFVVEKPSMLPIKVNIHLCA